MITTIILSRARPAQLDLLLQSVETNGRDWLDPWILEHDVATHGYEEVLTQGETRTYFGKFEAAVHYALINARAHICFMCDDGILYRPIKAAPVPATAELCFSLRYGRNTTRCYPSGLAQAIPSSLESDRRDLRWEWWAEHLWQNGDFGYPGSLDGHVFRTEDLRSLLQGAAIPNPTALEVALQEACIGKAGADPPLIPRRMSSFAHSVYVGNPVNRVSEQSRVRFGERFPASATELAARFAAGERLSLEAMDFSGVDGAHTELELHWEPAAAMISGLSPKLAGGVLFGPAGANTPLSMTSADRAPRVRASRSAPPGPSPPDALRARA